MSVEQEPTEMPEANLLLDRNREIDEQVKSVLSEKLEAARRHELPTLPSYPWIKTERDITALLEQEDLDPQRTSIGPPTTKGFEETEGVDLAFNVAGMAKQSGKHPVETAEELSEKIDELDLVESVRTAGPFVNVSLDHRKLAPMVFEGISRSGSEYGYFRDGEPRLVLVDYSAPNIAKNMTVAHLRSTIIGQSLTNIYEAAGMVPARINHLGDWGTQFGKIIYEYRSELERDPESFRSRLDENPTKTLMEIYRAFVKREPEDPEAAEQARNLFLQLEQGDPELVKLWNQVLEWSMEDFKSVYRRLRVEFDALQGESFYEDRMTQVVEEGLTKGVLKKNEEGAVVFPAQPLLDPTTRETHEHAMQDSKGNDRDEIVLKPNGGTVYITRDLAAIKYRTQELGAEHISYVVGKEQKRHFLILFTMAEQLGYIERGQAEHLDFGHLNVGGKKMKSREGKVVLLDDLLDEAVAAAEELIKERKQVEGDSSEFTPEEQETARRVGTAAVEFNDLRQDRKSDIEFNPEIAKTLESGQSPYIQYTYTRLRSIERKAGADAMPESVRIPEDLSPQEKAVIGDLAKFPSVVDEAAKRKAPHRVAGYLTELSKDITAFYRDQKVLTSDEKTRNFRLGLVAAARQVLENGSALLHIELPERM